MSQEPGSSKSAVVNAWSDEVEDLLHEDLVNRGESLPDMKELAAEAAEIEDIIQSEEKTPKQSSFSHQNKSAEDDDVVSLVKCAKSAGETKVQSTQPLKKPVVEPKRPSTRDGEEADSYQESFTSQEETAELRNHIDSLDSRLSSMEEMINAIMLERSNLPSHLHRHREEINKQFTIISDRLHTALEQNIDHTAVAQTAKDVNILSADANHTLGTLSTELTKEPKAGSATASNVPIARKPRRVRVVE